MKFQPFPADPSGALMSRILGTCHRPGCVRDDGCEACQVYRCPQCKRQLPWEDGGAPDPRCNSCVLGDLFSAARHNVADLAEYLGRLPKVVVP